MIYISGINYESFNDSPGVTCVIFISGCSHNCDGCHNPETHNFKNGVPLTNELVDSINNEIDKRPFLNGIVLSGGDPMYSALELSQIVPKIHIPKNNLTCFTGFTFEEICEDENKKKLLNYCNMLIDGMYEKDKRDITLQYRGSTNQRIWIKSNDNEWHILKE